MNTNRLKLFIRSRILAAKRRWAIRRHGEFDPYPERPEGLCFSPSQHTEAVARSMRPRLDWSDVGPDEIASWQKAARKRLRVLLGIGEAVSPPMVLSRSEMPIAKGYTRQRVYLRFSENCDAPVDIVQREDLVRANTGPAPVIICMQGTNSGAHLNLGEVRMPADVHKVASGCALALQAADQGYIAVSFERSCFGERRETQLKSHPNWPTLDAAFHMLIFGETLLGQTVAELEALRRWIGTGISPGAPVFIAGYSAAGTAAIIAAAAYPGFAGLAAGGCVGMMRETLLSRGASAFNEIPDVLQWFEFDAFFALIAPRICLVIAGEEDHIWPFSTAEPVVASACRAWKGLNAEDRIKLVRAPHGHTYYPEILWPAMNELISLG